jgi:predicted Ser/Thr protein kinase
VIVYIDDKAFNTFQFDLFRDMGFYAYSQGLDFKFLTNRHNKIRRVARDRICKSGPAIQGEIFWYSKMNGSDVLPTLYSSDKASLTIEYINGTGLDKLYYEGLLSRDLLKKLYTCRQDKDSRRVE